MAAVAVDRLFKSYGGAPAVTDLSFTVKQIEILGLIGPNGAGKSTTIKTLLDFIKPDSGEVKIFGQSMNETCKDRIGYLPEERGLYKDLTVIELILYLASLKGMNRATALSKAEVLLRQTDMLESKKKKIKHMSRGMAQLIQFIVTIIHHPDLIILDEPFSGLDPVNTELMKKIICTLRDEGRSIILSTHQMNQVEELCDRILMINKGQAVFYGDLRETIVARFKRNSVLVDVDGELGELQGIADKKTNKDYVELFLAPDTSSQDILDQLRDRGLTVNRFEISTPSLNDLFLDIVGARNE